MDTLVSHAQHAESSGGPFGGVPEASARRRAAAGVVDAVAVLGAPWLVTVVCVPVAVAFIELIPIVVVLLALACVAALAAWLNSRMPNGERLSVGTLVTGLTVMRTADAYLVVRARDVQGPVRPRRRRVIAARVAFAVTASVALILVSTVSWAAYTAFDQTGDQTAAEARSAELTPQADAVCAAFKAEVLAGGPDAGAGHVVEDAAAALPAFRDHLRRAGTTGLEEQGTGQSNGVWEYMFGEKTGSAVSGDQATLAITVEERAGRMVVTRLTWEGRE